MALIACRDASFAYEGAPAASGLNFAVNAGDYLCIVGENGSGKSTLVKGLLGLMPPRGGSVLTGDGLKRNEIGYMPQQTVVQKDFPAGVYEVVLSGRLASRGLLPFYSRADKAAAEENLRRLNIEALRNRCYRELSGGQQQRALLARALCATKKLLLLDEPVAGLDPIAAQELYKLIASVNKAGLTVIMVSHDIRSAVTYASHILHLNTAQVFFGATGEYLRTDTGRSFTGGGRDGN
jgi:zinc transport system ATP-binding protein